MMYTEVKIPSRRFCEYSREHAICYICREKFESKYLKNKKYCYVRDHCHYKEEYRGAAHSICNLKYIVPKKKFL